MTQAEIEITRELVRICCATSIPAWPMTQRGLAHGAGDNQLRRLGDDLAVRLPWATESADGLLRKEHTWLPVRASCRRSPFRNASASPPRDSRDLGSSPPGYRGRQPTAAPSRAPQKPPPRWPRF